MVSILQDTRNDISSSIVTRAHRVDTATVKMEHHQLVKALLILINTLHCR